MSSSGKLRLVIAVVCAAAWPSERLALAACVPTTQWRWDGFTRDPGYPVPLSLPVVARLTDHDGDGRIGSSDRPDVAFISTTPTIGPGRIHVLDSSDGSDLRTFTARDVASSGLAAGDLDGDGVVELVAFTADGAGLVAFHADGRLDWEVPLGMSVAAGWSLGIADLDQDGSPEIHFAGRVHGSDGSFRWAGAGGRGLAPIGVVTNVAIDLLPNPGLELVAGNTCYAASGAILWQRADLGDGLASVGDLDADGTPEIVLLTDSSPTRLNVLSRDGTSHTPPIAIGGIAMAPAALLDLEGDGTLEIVVANGEWLVACDWAGSILVQRWSALVTDRSCCGGISGFDLDADGVLEVLYRGDLGVHVIDGSDGSVAWTDPVPSLTFLELPVVADIDLDGVPEVVATGGTRREGVVAAYECDVPRPARCVWNQLSYHVTNVNDDGTIPRFETAPWTISAGFLQQEARECCVADGVVPDLLGWPLRARHVGHVVTMSWPGGRPLLPGEHYHVLKSYSDVGFARVNVERDLSTTFTETDPSRPLQFFDVRIASECEIESLDDEPPGWDGGHP